MTEVMELNSMMCAENRRIISIGCKEIEMKYVDKFKNVHDVI